MGHDNAKLTPVFPPAHSLPTIPSCNLRQVTAPTLRAASSLTGSGAAAAVALWLLRTAFFLARLPVPAAAAPSSPPGVCWSVSPAAMFLFALPALLTPLLLLPASIGAGPAAAAPVGARPAQQNTDTRVIQSTASLNALPTAVCKQKHIHSSGLSRDVQLGRDVSTQTLSQDCQQRCQGAREQCADHVHMYLM
jgi:hypothetical protein